MDGKAEQPSDTDAADTDGAEDTGDTEAGEDAVALPFEVVVSGRCSGWRLDTEFGIVSQAGLDFYLPLENVESPVERIVARGSRLRVEPHHH